MLSKKTKRVDVKKFVEKALKSSLTFEAGNIDDLATEILRGTVPTPANVDKCKGYLRAAINGERLFIHEEPGSNRTYETKKTHASKCSKPAKAANDAVKRERKKNAQRRKREQAARKRSAREQRSKSDIAA